MKKIVFSVLLLISAACTSEKSELRYGELDFLNSDTILADSLNPITINKPLKSVGHLFVKDNLIFIQASDGHYLLHAFDKNNGDYHSSMFRIGNGPDEFLPSRFYFSKSDTSLIVYSLMQNRMVEYRWASLLSGNYDKINPKITFSRQVLQAHPLKDRYIAVPIRPDNRFILFDDEGVEVSSYNNYPQINGISDKTIIKKLLHQTQRFAVKPDFSKIAMVTTLGSLMQIFDMYEDSLVLCKERGIRPPIVNYDSKSNYVVDPKCPIGMWGLVATKEYIFALASDKKIGEMDNSRNAILAEYVYVFDWNLTPLISYKIEGGVILNLAIDSQDNRAYILSLSDNGEERISFFELKNL